MWVNLIFTIVFFLVFVLFLIATLAYPAKASAFPLLAIIAALVLLAVQILREGLALRRQKKIIKAAESEEVKPRGYLVVAMWLAITVVMFFLLGFLATVILVPFLYTRRHGESWLLSVGLSLGCGLFFYALFALFLHVPMYKGLLLSAILG